MALHAKFVEKGWTDKIKAASADPGLASSNLQINSTSGDGTLPPGIANTIVGSGQSAPDGCLSCAMGAFSPLAGSGDFFMPKTALKGEPIKIIDAGVPIKKGADAKTCSKVNQENMWKWSEEALGIKFDI